MIRVMAPGVLATVQDLGRPGYAHLGVPPSGALDAPALRLANRLLGNDEGAAAIEMTLIGSTLRFHSTTSIVLTGASAPVRADERDLAMGTPIAIDAGTVVHVGPIFDGLRVYLAVRGGVDVPPVLGSRSTDQLTGLGPPPLTQGDVLPIGTKRGSWPGVDVAPMPRPDPIPSIAFLVGPRDDWFESSAVERLTTSDYVVTPDSNRIALKLTGPPLPRLTRNELPSEGLVTGSLQVPPSGQPILFLNDHPTTGGYPVIGTVMTNDLPKAAQLRPGDTLRFAQSGLSTHNTQGVKNV
jgi:biotin-dependent carboxylase-like uncharacterized protein